MLADFVVGCIMRLDELPTSDRVEDRRGLRAGPAGIGIGTVVVLALIGWALGIDPNTLIGRRADAARGQPDTATGSCRSAV